MKKVLILSALGVVSTAALAGTTTTVYNKTPTAVATADTDRGVYIEGLAGYNRHTLKNTYRENPNYTWSHGQGNWALGADVGYQFQRNLSAEIGSIYTFKSSVEVKEQKKGSTKTESTTIKYQPLYVYLAGKLSIPVYDNLSIFTKLGVGYQDVKANGKNEHNSDIPSAIKWGPMFGAGVSYNVTSAIYVTGEWLRFTGEVNMRDGSLIPSPNIFLAGVGYKFAM